LKEQVRFFFSFRIGSLEMVELFGFVFGSLEMVELFGFV
jgi:hypothetical protein